MEGDAPRCGDCGQIIGVYEPLIALDSGRVRETSRAQDPVYGHAERVFHRDCWLRRADRLESVG